MSGLSGGLTTKVALDVACPYRVVTSTFPLAAPAGTSTRREVSVLWRMRAGTPLKRTAVVAVRERPWMSTTVPHPGRAGGKRGDCGWRTHVHGGRRRRPGEGCVTAVGRLDRPRAGAQRRGGQRGPASVQRYHTEDACAGPGT
jgi:hypothetical protein